MLTTYFMYGWAASPERLAAATVTTIAFAVLAYALHAVNHRQRSLADSLVSYCFREAVQVHLPRWPRSS